MKMTIDAPSGGHAERLCDALRDMGYTVTSDGTVPGTRRLVADVMTPHGEVASRRYLQRDRRRA
jgi:hypothetical protein